MPPRIYIVTQTPTSPQQQQQQNEAAHQQEQQQPDRRRSSRCNGEKIDEWIRIPVEATVLVDSGSLETLEGTVFLSPSTGRKWRKNRWWRFLERPTRRS